MRTTLCILMLAMAGCTPDESGSPFHLSRLISDGMVAQRDLPFPVWGTAPAGTLVEVRLGDEVADTQAHADGRWLALLAERPAGGDYDLSVTAGDTTVSVEGITFGDVWIASGQSNMEWVVADSRNAEAETAGSDDPGIRHFKVPRGWSHAPQQKLEGGEWQQAAPESVGAFTAVGYFFARALRQHHDVPIGIINTTWGGSRIEPWMDAEALGMSEGEAMAMEREEFEALEAVRQRVEALVGPLPEKDPGLVDGVARWADPNMDTSNWADIEVPGLWEQAGYEGVDGIGWYRTEFQLSAEEAAGAARIGVGQIDDSDISWINGEQVGRMEQRYNVAREYEIPADVLRPGRNVVAVRVEDTGGGGGIWGPAELLWLETSQGRRSLAGSWKFKVGAARVSLESQRNQMPTLLYNQMVHPLLPQPVTGFLWYQGESNAGGEDAVAYAEQFRTMITTWRDRFRAEEAPFLYVQLANFLAPQVEPSEGGWALIRESQSSALSLPAVGEAVTIDIGEADDIHPRNKQDVGERLALAARHFAFGEVLVYSGPVYRTHRVEGSRLVLEFEHVGSGLAARGGKLDGFALAGEDGQFVWAHAVIEGDEVVLSSPEVPNPAAARYAWANNPDRANLYNVDGLPASPFRTDR